MHGVELTTASSERARVHKINGCSVRGSMTASNERAKFGVCVKINGCFACGFFSVLDVFLPTMARCEDLIWLSSRKRGRRKVSTVEGYFPRIFLSTLLALD